MQIVELNRVTLGNCKGLYGAETKRDVQEGRSSLLKPLQHLSQGDDGLTIKGIVFDLDDTLLVEVASAAWAFDRASGLALAKRGIEPKALGKTAREKAKTLWHNSPARDYCVRVGVSSWEGLWARFEGQEKSVSILREWAPTYRRQTWKLALEEHGVRDIDLAGRMAEAYYTERRRRHVLFEDSLDALSSVHGLFRLGLVTNGLSCLQREKIRGAVCIEPYFDTIVISGDVGVAKPARDIFCKALEDLELLPEETVMVGNGMRTDIKGAQNVGMHTIFITRGDPHGGTTDIWPDVTIESLRDVIKVIGQFDETPGLEGRRAPGEE